MACNCGAKKHLNGSVRQVTKKQYSVNRLKRGNGNNQNNGLTRIIRRVISH